MNEPVNCAICGKESPEYENSLELDELGWTIDILRGTENQLMPEIRILCPECNKKRSEQKGLEITQEGNLFLENYELKKQLAKIQDAWEKCDNSCLRNDQRWLNFFCKTGEILKGKSNG